MAEKTPVKDKHPEAFSPYEKMPMDTNGWTSRHLDAIKQWVALEKIHGANFSFTVSTETPGGEIGPARAAKRTAYLKEGENFYGLCKNRALLEEEGEKARRLFSAVREGHCSDVSSVTVFGELLGGWYPHPDVPQASNAVKIQREVVYCPENRFITYDVAVMHTDNTQVFLDYDMCMQLFSRVGFLFSEPLKTGTLQDMLSLELAFETKLPAKFKLPPLADRKNTAEGVVVKPLKNTVLDTRKGPRRVIFKRKGKEFNERRKPWVPPTSDGGNSRKKKQGDWHQVTMKYELSALVCEQRLVNTISKRGVPDSERDWTELTEALATDMLESGESENEKLWGACGGPSNEVLDGLREECRQLVEMYRVNQSMADVAI